MNQNCFHLLGRAVIRFQGRILIAREKGSTFTFLPGGHVEIGESVPDCIRRELREEMGMNSLIENYLGAVEHQWCSHDTHHFEINHLFAATLEGITSFGDVESKEDHLEFFWVDPSELVLQNLKPEPLALILSQPAIPDAPAIWASTLEQHSPA